MDPVSIAGLSLSAASLGFQLFAGCIKGFVLLSTAHNLGKDSSTLICMLNLQELRLTEWAKIAGLLSEDARLDKRLNETAVHTTLKELQDLMLDTEKLKSRYKLSLTMNPHTPHNESYRDFSPVAHGILSQSVPDHVRGDIMYRAHLIQARNSFPQRLWWAAVDKARLEELVNKIRTFIQELWYLLDPIQQGDMSRTLHVILSHIIGMSEKVDGLSSLRDALVDSSDNAPSNLDGQSNSLASAAEVRTVSISVGGMTSGTTSTAGFLGVDAHRIENLSNKLSRCDAELIKDYVPLKSNPDMGVAVYQDKHVFVEWKTLPHQFRSKIAERVEELAYLLNTPKHPDFRSLQCTGLTRDKVRERIAFIFDVPLLPTLKLPRTLRNLFGLNPSITERLRLALQITQSVKYFHTAGWLHKNLRSENILFWPDDTSSSPISQPVLADFAFSRQDSPSQISEQPSSSPGRDIYRHPDAMGEPSVSFTASKDIYALGTILLEIGEWRSLKSLVERIVDVNRNDVSLDQLAAVKPFLLDESAKGGLGMLKFRMGDIYAKVTRMMLSGEMPETSEKWKGAEVTFQPDLLEIAIFELERCII